MTGKSSAYHTMWKDGRGEVGIRVVTGSDSQHGLVCSLHDALQILQRTLHLQRQIITQQILYRETSVVYCINYNSCFHRGVMLSDAADARHYGMAWHNRMTFLRICVFDIPR